MSGIRTFALRPWLAVVLVFILLAGAGRAPTLASDGPTAALSIAGVPAPICHSGTEGNVDTGSAPHHDCCEFCALCAPAALPGGHDLTVPARAIRYVTHEAALAWTPALARVRTPRLAQGPPVA